MVFLFVTLVHLFCCVFLLVLMTNHSAPWWLQTVVIKLDVLMFVCET